MGLAPYNAPADRRESRPLGLICMKVLVIDVGGTNVKLSHSDHDQTRRFRSGDKLTPERFVGQVKRITRDWTYDVISLGLPVPIKQGKPSEITS
jgi:hypothetical protein